MSTIDLDEGWDKLIRNLNNLAPRLQKNILRGAMRAEAAHMATAVKDKAPVLNPGTRNPHERYPGQLRDAVESVSLNPGQTPGSVIAGVKIRGSREALGETVKAVKSLRKGAKGVGAAARALGKSIGTAFYWRWEEYGSPHNRPPVPFIRPAWDEQKSGSLQRIADYIRDRLDKLVHD